MGVGTSGLGRQSIGVLSAAIGLVALRNPSNFWVGVVSMMVAFWLISGLTLGLGSLGRERMGWWVFAAGIAASLALSFGPWSDTNQRAAWPNPWTWSARSERLQPASRLLAGMIPIVRPQAQAVISWREPSGVLTTRLEVTGSFDRLDGLDPVRDQMARIAARMPIRAGVPGPETQTQRAIDALESSLSMADYQTVGHLLLALLFGSLLRWSVHLAAVRPALTCGTALPGSSF